MELAVHKYRLYGKNDFQNLIQPKRFENQTADELRGHLHFRPIHPSFASLLRLRSILTASFHRWFLENDFCHVDVPLISQNNCESCETFKVEAHSRLNPEAGINPEENSSTNASETKEPYRFFDRDVYLPVSSQLHLEAIVGTIPRVYTINPAFRAERSLSVQHLAEFRMLEAEMAYVDNLDDVMNIVEKCILHCATQLQNCRDEIESVRKVYGSANHQTCLFEMGTQPFPRIRFEEALSILNQKNDFDTRPTKESGLKKEHEQYLVRHFSGPVFVTNFPSVRKPFYMKQSHDGESVLCFDLLAPAGGEICGGSLREHSCESLQKRIGDIRQLDWYVDLRRYGHPPSGGFGIGVERILQMFLGIANIKDVIAFPRWYKHCDM